MDIDLNHHAVVVFIMFLNCKVTLSFAFPYSTFERKSLRTTYTERMGSYINPPKGQASTHNLYKLFIYINIGQ